MKNIQNTSTVIDILLPTYGNPSINLPVWNESQKMFITSEYESAAGNRYYIGIRPSKKVAIIEKVGLYHSFSYIDSLELFSYDNTNIKLLAKKNYDKVFYNSDFIKNESLTMLIDYFRSCLKIQGTYLPTHRIEEESKKIIEQSYESFLSDDYQLNIRMLLLIIEKNK